MDHSTFYQMPSTYFGMLAMKAVGALAELTDGPLVDGTMSQENYSLNFHINPI